MLQEKERESTSQTALVTGAGQGIGRALALSLAARGYVVFVNDVGAGRADQVVAEVLRAGGEAYSKYADISDSVAVNNMVDGIIKEFGHIDILVNNARAEPPRPESLPHEEWWDRIFAVNLKGAYLCSMACFENMKEQGFGRIVNISSIQAYAGKAEDDWIAYSSAKSGLQGLTRSLAKRGMTSGITVNIVAPDYIETEVMEKRWGRVKMAQYAQSVPMGRGGKPDDVVKAVLFLVDSGFITGETIFVNGGRFVLS
ncbi:SDR family NAD(P)-dependent oxidoreductase [Sphingobacterium chuzhouense]|uniref:SDR family oxidoreductase n=1 Tax=Sphingobacterium chuzhouense TaxID=1742264 RepID=A0ABR7XT28_9SPHI|nr:SDR family NAD(P)-dependent oxidoreductase [Sphingobacterium chuzhouense]MBD1422335.1 SDR family oxidoreductase [Sphingobacterium chuzhouense]